MPPSYGQFSTGIMPLPGTPAYEAMIRNVVSANPVNDAQADMQRQAIQAQKRLWQNTGENFGIAQPAIQRLGGMGGLGGLGGVTTDNPGGAGGGFSSSSSSSGTGAGLMEEILGLIRGTGGKEMQKARSRLTEDYGTAREQKMSDLARRGLFRAGIGEKELLAEVDKPFARGTADLESAMADSNVDTQLRKAAILGDIEAQARRAAAERQAQMFQSGAAAGTGATRINPSAGSTFDRPGGAGADAGGIFGAQFVDARKKKAADSGGGYAPTYTPMSGISSAVFGSGGGPDMSGGAMQTPLIGGQMAANVANPAYTPIRSTSGSMGYRLPSGAFVYGKPPQQSQLTPSWMAGPKNTVMA